MTPKASLRLLTIVPVLVTCAACSKPDPTRTGDPSAASATASAVASGAASGQGSAAASGAGSNGSLPGAVALRSVWNGTYTAAVGSQELSLSAKDSKEAKTADDAARGVGQGTMELSIDSSNVRGSAKGPLGSLALSGVFEDRQIRVQALPMEPNAADAMTGWMLLTAEGDSAAPGAFAGTLRVSGRDAKLVREATVRLTRR